MNTLLLQWSLIFMGSLSHSAFSFTSLTPSPLQSLTDLRKATSCLRPWEAHRLYYEDCLASHDCPACSINASCTNRTKESVMKGNLGYANKHLARDVSLPTPCSIKSELGYTQESDSTTRPFCSWCSEITYTWTAPMKTETLIESQGTTLWSKDSIF